MIQEEGNEITLICFDIRSGRCIFSSSRIGVDDHHNWMTKIEPERIADLIRMKEMFFCGYAFKNIVEMKQWVLQMVNRLDIRQDEYCDDIQRKNPEVQYVQLIDEEWYRILISENPFHRLKEAIACLTTGWASKYLPKNLVYDLMRNYSDGTTKVLEDQYSVLNQLQELTTKYLIETNEFDQIEP